MTDFFNIPETAIAAFETWSRLQVFVWDLEQTHFLPYLSPIRINTTFPHCLALRNGRLRHKCTFFEFEYIFEKIGQHPEGLLKRCHAGLLEWCVPIYLERRMVSIVYAGHRTAVFSAIPHVLPDPQPASTELPWDDTPAPVSAAEADLFMEGLRQLAARLQAWLLEAQTIIGTPPTFAGKGDLMTRRNFILNFIYERHAQTITLADLAQQLHLSQSRTAHVVKEACGKTFGTLLAEARIRSATTLLRHSQLPVNDIAYQCGFRDPSRFFKLFKQQTGLTPTAFRQQRWQLERI